MIPWVLLAPAVAGGFSIRRILITYREWRAGEASLADVFEEFGLAGLMTGAGAGAMLHPFLAISFIAVIGSIETRELLRLRQQRLEQKQPAAIEAPEE